jgi:hypothetical protein
MPMRTTVTLDEDVASRLRALARERGVPFKQVLNDAVRRGLQDERAAGPYRVRTRRLGLRGGIDLDRALRFAAESEDDEIVRKLELRK